MDHLEATRKAQEYLTDADDHQAQAVVLPVDVLRLVIERATVPYGD